MTVRSAGYVVLSCGSTGRSVRLASGIGEDNVSWDLAFWKPNGSSLEQPGTVYESLLEDDEPEGVDWLSVDRVKAGFRAAFPEITDELSELNWEGAGSYFQVSWAIGSKPGHTLGVFVTCGGSLLGQPAVIERVRAVGSSLGCGVFDPQIDAWSPPTGPV
jgi:hypothetical protein